MLEVDSQTEQIVSWVCLAVTTFLTINMSYHLWALSKEETTSDRSILRVRNRMSFGVVWCSWWGIMYIIIGLVWEMKLPSSDILCHVLFRFWFFAYSAHKFGLYWFIYWRVSTFEDFLSDCVRCTMVHGGRCIGVLFGLYWIGNWIVWDARIQSSTTSTCSLDGLSLSLLVCAALQVLVDFLVGLSGIIFFVHIFFCGILRRVTERDPEVGKSARRVVVWSFVALVSTFLIVVLTILGANFVLSIDVMINVWCLGMQYPDAVVALLLRIVSSVSEERVGLTAQAGDRPQLVEKQDSSLNLHKPIAVPTMTDTDKSGETQLTVTETTTMTGSSEDEMVVIVATDDEDD